MESIYFPYTKKESVNIVRQYFGYTKKQAEEYLDHTIDFADKYVPWPDCNSYVGRTVAALENGLIDRAKFSFYND